MKNRLGRRIMHGSIIAVLSLSAVVAASLSRTAELDKAVSERNPQAAYFGISADAINDALNIDLETYQSESHINCTELLACLSTKYGGDLSRYKKGDAELLAASLGLERGIDELALNIGHYRYYKDAYDTIIGGIIGKFQRNGELRYGITAFFPIADGFDHQIFESGNIEICNSSNNTEILIEAGCDTPIIAVESGIVEDIVQCKCDGMTLLIRSHDGKRRYRYTISPADVRYDDIAVGRSVTSGDVIGSIISDFRNTVNPHLHFEMSIITGNCSTDNGISVNVGEIVKLLERNRMAVKKCDDGRYIPCDSIIVSAIAR